MDGDLATRLAKALAEAAELRQENARLSGLLGLDTRRGAGHRRAWAPTLFSQPIETDPIGDAAPTHEKVALLRTLFGARSDVFAVRWENATTSKSGWSPVCQDALRHRL